MEVFKPIAGYESFYLVSNMGRVVALAKDSKMPKGATLRHRPQTVLKGKTVKGYRLVTLMKHGVRKEVAVHRLVCIAFHGEPPSHELQVNHKDGQKSNNAESNLEWVTPSENVLHSFKVLGRVPLNRRPIEAVSPSSGQAVARYPSISAVSVAGFTPSNVIAALKGRLKTSGGLIWRYAA